MESKRLKNLYNSHLNELVAFSEDADYLDEQSKREFLGYKIKDFKDTIKQEHKREEFLKKGANKMYRITLKAMRQELKARAKQRRKELVKLALMAKYENADDITVIENIANCETCAHYCVNTDGNKCCNSYNITFRSDELRQQFCACYCSAYKQFAEDEAKTTADNNDVEEELSEEVTPQPDDDPQEEIVENDAPNCCRDCAAYIDSDDGCFCNKYGKYLNDCDAADVCCCEQDDFFDDEENTDE